MIVGFVHQLAVLILLLFLALSNYHLQLKLGTFEVYNTIIWYTHKLWNDYYNQIN
jgi:hypothetical protein